MYLAAEKDGIELTPISGYRSFTRQRNNFERKINKYLDQGYSKAEATKMAATIILPPGTSEHNAGLAMDICSLEQSSIRPQNSDGSTSTPPITVHPALHRGEAGRDQDNL